MKPEIIIELVRSKGITLNVKDGQVLFQCQKGAMTPELKQSILEHKPQILELLRREQMALMKLKDLSKGDFAVKIFSQALGKEVYFCSNEAMRNSIRSTGLSAYMPDELAHIIALQPDDEALKSIDEVKQIFPEGTII